MDGAASSRARSACSHIRAAASRRSRPVRRRLHGPEVCIETLKGPHRALVLQPILHGLQLHEALLVSLSSHARDPWNARMAFLDSLSAPALLRATLAAVRGASPVLHEQMPSAEG